MSEKPASKPAAKSKPKAPAQAAPALPLTLYRGACNSWECDHLGHMNIRYYIERAQQSWAMFAVAAAMPEAFHRDSTSTLLPREIHMRLHNEIRPGYQLIMSGGVLDVSDETVTLYHELRFPWRDNAVAATYRTVLGHVQAKQGKAFAWSKKAREAMARLMISGVPDYAAPRSLELHPPSGSASLARALELKAPLSGLSQLGGTECDNFMRMRPEFVLGRQSDAGMNYVPFWHSKASEALARKGETFAVAGALVEARLLFHRWPEPGDLLQSHSGLVSFASKTLRFVHWLVDPVTGECWAETDNVLAHFDITNRRAYAPPEELNSYLESHVVKGLTL